MKVWILVALFNQGDVHESTYVDPWTYEYAIECRVAAFDLRNDYGDKDTISDVKCISVEFKSEKDSE